jgi:hypothetical protein
MARRAASAALTTASPAAWAELGHRRHVRLGGAVQRRVLARSEQRWGANFRWRRVRQAARAQPERHIERRIRW